MKNNPNECLHESGVLEINTSEHMIHFTCKVCGYKDSVQHSTDEYDNQGCVEPVDIEEGDTPHNPF